MNNSLDIEFGNKHNFDSHGNIEFVNGEVKLNGILNRPELEIVLKVALNIATIHDNSFRVSWAFSVIGHIMLCVDLFVEGMNTCHKINSSYYNAQMNGTLAIDDISTDNEILAEIMEMVVWLKNGRNNCSFLGINIYKTPNCYFISCPLCCLTSRKFKTFQLACEHWDKIKDIK